MNFIGNVYQSMMPYQPAGMTLRWPALVFCMLLTMLITACSSSDNAVLDNSPLMNDLTLQDIAWEMTHYTDSDGQLARINEATKYQFLFPSNATVFQAFIGCVNYAGSTYELLDGYLVLHLGARDGVECITDSFYLSQGIAIEALISGGEAGRSLALSYSVLDGQLSLQAADGRQLIFKQIAAINQQE